MILFEALQAVINAQENQSLREVLENPAGFAQKQAAKADKTKSAETAGTQRKRSDVVLTYQELQTLWKLYQGNKEAIEEVLKNPKNAQLKTIITALQAAQAPIAAFMEKNPESENIFNEFLKSYKTAFPTTDIPAAPALKAFLEIMFAEEENPLPEDLYKKFQGVFGSMREVMVYLNAYKEDVKKGFSVHDSLLFELPDFESMTEEWRKFWHSMAKEHLKDTPFRKILGQANDLTKFMADNEKELEATGGENFATLHKKLKQFKDLEKALINQLRVGVFKEGALSKADLWKQLKDCKADIKYFEAALDQGSDLQIKLAEIRKKINESIKEERRIKTLRTVLVGDNNPERDRLNVLRTEQEKITAKHQLELVKLAPTMAEITLTDILAYKTAYIQKMQGSFLGYFTNNQLTLKDFEYFQTLCASPGNKTAGKNLPDIKFDFERGGKRYYVKKLHVQNPEEAAIAACLGKLTGCCQYLGGVGADCAVHGLTNENSGFYVVYQGDINHPKITDPLVGQCWAWRSQTGAIVFDSVEPNRSGGWNIIDLGQYAFRELAHKLVSTGGTHKVDCGDSGMSRSVGVPTQNELEILENYHGYSDARDRQLGIYSKETPYYLYKEEKWAKEETHALLETLMSSQDRPDTVALLKLVEFANIDNNTERQDSPLYKHVCSLPDKRVQLALRILSFTGEATNKDGEEKIVKEILEDLKGPYADLYFCLQGGTSTNHLFGYALNKHNLLMRLSKNETLLVSVLNSDAFKDLSEIQKIDIFYQQDIIDETLFKMVADNKYNDVLKIILKYLSLEKRFSLIVFSKKTTQDMGSTSVLRRATDIKNNPGLIHVILENLQDIEDEKKIELLYYKGLNEDVMFGMMASPAWTPFLMQHMNDLALAEDIKTLMKFMGYGVFNKNSVDVFNQGFYRNAVMFCGDEKVKDILKIYEFFHYITYSPSEITQHQDKLQEVLHLLKKNPEYWFLTGKDGNTLLHYLAPMPELMEKALTLLKEIPTEVQSNLLKQKNVRGEPVITEVFKMQHAETMLDIVFEELTAEQRLLMIGKRPKQDYTFHVVSTQIDPDNTESGVVYLYPTKQCGIRQDNGNVKCRPFDSNNAVYLSYFDDLEAHLSDPEFKKEVLSVLARVRDIPYEGEALIEWAIKSNDFKMLDLVLSYMPKAYKADVLDQAAEGVDLVRYAILNAKGRGNILSVLLKHYGVDAVIERSKYFFTHYNLSNETQSLRVLLDAASPNNASLFKLFESFNVFENSIRYKCGIQFLLPYFNKLTEEQKIQLLAKNFIIDENNQRGENASISYTLMHYVMHKRMQDAFSILLGSVAAFSPENRRAILQQTVGGVNNLVQQSAFNPELFESLLAQFEGAEEDILEILLLKKDGEARYLIFSRMTPAVFPIMVNFILKYPEKALDFLCTPEAIERAAQNPQCLKKVLQFVSNYPDRKKSIQENPEFFVRSVGGAENSPDSFVQLMDFFEGLSLDAKLNLFAKNESGLSVLGGILNNSEACTILLKMVDESSDPEKYLVKNAHSFMRQHDPDVLQPFIERLKKIPPQRKFELFSDIKVDSRWNLLFESSRNPRVFKAMLPLFADLSEHQLFNLLSGNGAMGIVLTAVDGKSIAEVLKLMEKLTPEHQLAILQEKLFAITPAGEAAIREARPLLDARIKALEGATATLAPNSPTVLAKPRRLPAELSSHELIDPLRRRGPDSPRSQRS